MKENKKFENISSNSNDEYVIGKGFELDDISSSSNTKKKKKKEKKSSGALKTLIWILSISLVSLGLAFATIYAGADYMGIGFGRNANKKCEVNIAMGTPTSEIAEQLGESGAVKLPILFRLYTKLMKYDSQFKFGYYNFESESGYEAICQMLITEGAKAESIEVTIPEGTGINDYTKNVNGEKVTVPGIGTLLEEAGVCTKADFLDALNKVSSKAEILKHSDEKKTFYALEGYLFPETYQFYAYDSEECALLAVEKMINETDSRITEEMYQKADELGYNMNEILTMASIIQLEAGIETKTEEAKARLKDNMKGVASVFYNRLNASDTGGTLGSSPTLFYGDSFKYDDGRYNTQADDDFAAIKGLPPGPICSPGIDAINAALDPKTSDYKYFVTDSEGNFYFHKTITEQNATISKLKQGKKWIYEYFN